MPPKNLIEDFMKQKLDVDLHLKIDSRLNDLLVAYCDEIEGKRAEVVRAILWKYFTEKDSR